MEKTESLAEMGEMVPGALLVSPANLEPSAPMALRGFPDCAVFQASLVRKVLLAATVMTVTTVTTARMARMARMARSDRGVQVERMAKMVETVRTVNRGILERLARLALLAAAAAVTPPSRSARPTSSFLEAVGA